MRRRPRSDRYVNILTSVEPVPCHAGRVTAAGIPDGFEFSTDPDRIDRARVHELLATHAYWAQGRTLEEQERIVAASRNYGVYAVPGDQQVAYARVVTDGATFAWLADVIVDPLFRGRGLGRGLIDALLADLEPSGLKRIVLKASDDAKTLYRRAGWAALDGPDAWMELRPRA